MAHVHAMPCHWCRAALCVLIGAAVLAASIPTRSSRRYSRYQIMANHHTRDLMHLRWSSYTALQRCGHVLFRTDDAFEIKDFR